MEAHKGSKRKITPPNDSEAAAFNRRVLKKLQAAFDRNSEVDLLSALPLDYSNRVQSKIEEIGHTGQESSRQELSIEPKKRKNNNDILSTLDSACPAEVVYPLSSSISDALMVHGQGFDKTELSRSVSSLLSECEVIYRGPIPTARTIFRCSPGAVVKVVQNADDYTEYTTLQFLDEHVPDFPSPKPLGVLRIGQLSLIFTSYISGETLEEIWPQLMANQKPTVMDQLERILFDLRSISRPLGLPLGGVRGEGCKDFRRHIRRNKEPVYTVEQYDDFLFSNVRFGSKIFIGFLRKFTQEASSQVCFSHGDIRPANIIVQRDNNGLYQISGLVDWEFSGFYPSHYEATKATNCLSTDEISDWYNYLPSCLSPHKWPRRWLLDYILGWLLE